MSVTDILSWASWLGVGGIVGLIGATYLLPSILPVIVVNLVKGAADLLAGFVQWLFGSILLPGATYILASRAATLTLIVGIIVGGWAGDRYEFVRPWLPAWAQSEPGQVKKARAQEAAKYKAKQKQAAPKKTATRSAWDDLKCGLSGNCAR